MKKTAIVYHYFAHYRAPIFRSLADSEVTDYYFLGDPVPGNDIKLINFSTESKLKHKFIPLKNTWLGKGFLWQKNLLRNLKDNDFDAVIFLGDIKFISTWIALILTRLKGRKAYLWGHGLYGKERWLNLKVKLLLLKLANGIFLYNNRARQLFLKNGVPAEKLIVIYNSLNFAESEHFRQKYSGEKSRNLLNAFANPELPVVFCIGRINKVKKLDMLIQAIYILKQRNVLYNCFLIGDGEEKDNLVALVKKLHLEDQVNFTGALYGEGDISQYIMTSDLCVCPGAIGLTGIHSLSYGVPVISNDNFSFQGPEHEAVTPGINGDFFQENNTEDLANKIEDCIRIRMHDKEKSIENCVSVIREYYNPDFQRKTIDAILSTN